MTKITPVGNLVILLPVPQQSKTPGGIVYAQAWTPAQQIWRVLHVGPGKLNRKGVRIPIDLKPGDKVVTAEILNNRAVYTDGVQVVDADEILAKIEG